MILWETRIGWQGSFPIQSKRFITYNACYELFIRYTSVFGPCHPILVSQGYTCRPWIIHSTHICIWYKPCHPILVSQSIRDKESHRLMWLHNDCIPAASYSYVGCAIIFVCTIHTYIVLWKASSLALPHVASLSISKFLPFKAFERSGKGEGEGGDWKGGQEGREEHRDLISMQSNACKGWGGGVIIIDSHMEWEGLCVSCYFFPIFFRALWAVNVWDW